MCLFTSSQNIGDAMTAWQPIETAPQEKLVILYAPGWDPEVTAGKYEFGEWREGGYGECMIARNPTHWMPLPEPPK
jgi:hypothetical protein